MSDGPILVPLDGSELAEGVLGHAVKFARALQALIVLVSVSWEGNRGGLAGLVPSVRLEIEKTSTERAAEYLRGVRDRLRVGPPVEALVRVGSAADEILHAAEELDARLLVIATHGRSGVKRWFYGSVTGHLLRESRIPVLTVGPRARSTATNEMHVGHIMVPLDGSEYSEAALPVAKELAAAFGARLSLVRVVPWAVDYVYPGQPTMYEPKVDQALEEAAVEYLDSRRETLGGAEVKCFVRRGTAAARLLDFIGRQRPDLVVMTTHAGGPLARATLGSVADRVLRGSAPVYLLRPK